MNRTPQTVVATLHAQQAAMLSAEDGAVGQGKQGGERLEARCVTTTFVSRERAKARKQRMRERCERLEAVLVWALIALDYDCERAQRMARDLVRNALGFAKWLAGLSGYDYERMALRGM